MTPKAAHLGPAYAAQFRDESVARAYRTRPPYPGELFDRLERLMPAGPRSVLDLGCGTGDIALGLVERADRIDALDTSSAMLRVARARRRSPDARVRWLECPAEAFRPDACYSLIVAAESLHWMEWAEVFSWLPDALLPGAYLCLVSGREIGPVGWRAELGDLISEYSTNREYRPYDLASELGGRGLFVEVGRCSTAPVPCVQAIGTYIESFHSRNGFSRERMTATAASAFDQALRRVVARHCPDGWVHGKTTATAIWGTPRRPDSRRS